jgi:hypothetical protein
MSDIEKLKKDDILDCYDALIEDDFFATMGGWDVPRARISKLLGKDVGARYAKWMDCL